MSNKTSCLKLKIAWSGVGILVILLIGCVRRTPGTIVPPSEHQTIFPTLGPGILPSSPPSPTSSPATLTPSPATEQPQSSPVEVKSTPTPILASYNRQAWSDTSPYGPWQALFLIAYPEGENGSPIGDQYYVRVNLVNLESGSVRTIHDEWRTYGLGFTIPQVFLWSNDGEYLFLAETGSADGSGERFYDQLERLQLEDGKLVELNLPGGPGESISADGKMLARIDGERLDLIKIETGEVNELTFEVPRVEWRTGQIVWSPEGRTILFTVRLNPFAPVDEMFSNLYLADLETGSVKTLIADDRRRFSILSFPKESAALLADLEAREWWLSVPNGQVQVEPPDDIALATQAIQTYFRALNTGLYQEAARWYGGSYDTLREINPDISPDDAAMLLERGCTINGFQCLAVDSLLLEQGTSDGRFLFEVSFSNIDGNLFILGPCCGADIDTQPPTWLFQYSVNFDANERPRVMELPVYSP